MRDRNMEDIDKLFREGLNPENDTITFQEEDWLKLKDRLEGNKSRKKAIYWITRLGGVAALLFLFLMIRILLPEQQKQGAEPNETKTEIAKTDEKQNQTQAPTEITKPAEVKKPVYVASMAKEKIKVTTQPAKKQATTNLPENTAAKSDSAAANNTTVPKELTGQKVPSGESNIQAAKQDTVKSPTRESNPVNESPLLANTEPELKPEPERQMRKLALSVLVAPDYNGVDNLNNAKMGNDLGLMLTYGIAKNWSVSTGGIYAKKLYDASYTSYQPTKNLWTKYYPSSVNADCRVLDIPVNISYAFLNRNKTKILLGTGISSYIMLRENYHFNYYKVYKNTLVDYRVVNENQHWLSVVNVQASIEQQINSRLSISLQPFMKIPLKNIGFAGVKLQTLGLAVNLNWNFNL